MAAGSVAAAAGANQSATNTTAVQPLLQLITPALLYRIAQAAVASDTCDHVPDPARGPIRGDRQLDSALGRIVVDENVSAPLGVDEVRAEEIALIQRIGSADSLRDFGGLWGCTASP